MHRFLSITNLLLWLLFGVEAPARAQSLELPIIRQKGASLSPSVANEADHAMRQALLWLRKTPPLNSETQTCALVKIALASEADAPRLAAWAETAGLTAKTNQAKALLAACVATYPPTSPDPETLWLLSRAINLFHKGLLLRGTEVLDWRNDFAQLLICSQRKEPSSGAYWEPADPSGTTSGSGSAQPRPPASGSALNASTESRMLARIRATAFGILALKEIHE